MGGCGKDTVVEGRSAASRDVDGLARAGRAPGATAKLLACVCPGRHLLQGSLLVSDWLRTYSPSVAYKKHIQATALEKVSNHQNKGINFSSLDASAYCVGLHQKYCA